MTSPLANLLGGGRRRLTLLARGHLPVGYSHGTAERRGAKEGGSASDEEGRLRRDRDGEGCGGAHAHKPRSLPLRAERATTFHYLPSAADQRAYCCQSVHSQPARFNE